MLKRGGVACRINLIGIPNIFLSERKQFSKLVIKSRNLYIWYLLFISNQISVYLDKLTIFLEFNLHIEYVTY